MSLEPLLHGSNQGSTLLTEAPPKATTSSYHRLWGVGFHHVHLGRGHVYLDFLSDSVVKESVCNARDSGSIAGSERSLE